MAAGGRPVRRGRLLALVVVAGLAVTAALLARAWRHGPRPVRAGGRLDIRRCPRHGVAFDVELEMCPACARAAEPPR
jgi:hypothetical protein